MIDRSAGVVQTGGHPVERSTLKGMQTASAESGVSFHYLLAKAAQESGFNSNAQAKTSSASGLFQFTRGTWLDMMRRQGDELGFGDLAAQVKESATGRLTVLNEDAEIQMLAMRHNADISSKFAALFAQENSKTLETSLGREASLAELYLAHFLGAWGATALMTAAEQEPTKPAVELLPAAAHANKNVFFSADGVSRSAAGVVSWLKDKFAERLDKTADIASLFEPKQSVQPDLPLVEHQTSSLGAGSTSPFGAGSTSPFGAGSTSPFDVNQAARSSDATQMGIPMYLLQILAEMMNAQPMQMVDDPFAMTPSGFSVGDWGSVLAETFNSQSDQTSAAAWRACRNAANADSGMPLRTSA
tara:strand:+ start:204 stop:1280 length:1077 start_codon:yes stop_codon:yes gene_type:complete